MLLNLFEDRIEPVYAMNILLNLSGLRTGVSNMDYEEGRANLNERMKQHMSKIGQDKNFIKRRTNTRIKNGGYKFSKETKLKMSESARGKVISEETKLKMSQSHKGKKKSKEHLDKIRKSLKGRRVSEQTKKKISEKLKGRFNKGSNPSAKTFIIFNKFGEVERACFGDFHNYCRENNFPVKKLRDTLNGGVVKYKQIKEKDKHFLKFEGWYIGEVEITLDLRITGFNYGTPGTKNENLISSLNVETEDGLLKTSPGGIAEADMEYITENQDELMGKLVEVKCSGLSKDSEGNWACLHPVFVKIRDDKNEGDTLESARQIEKMAKGLS